MDRLKCFLVLIFFLGYSLPGVSSKLSLADSLLQSVSNQPIPVQIAHLIQESIHYRDSSIIKSIQIGRLALDVAQRYKHPVLQGKAYKNQGINYIYHGDLDSALLMFYYAISDFRTGGEDKELAKTLGNCGVVYRRMGNFEKALESYMESLEIYEDIGYEKGLGSLYLNIGGVYQEQGKLDEAASHFQQALCVFEKLEDYLLIARALNNLGVNYQERKQYGKALEYYEGALAVNEQNGNVNLGALIRMNIGLIHSALGDFQRATEYYNETENIRKRLSDQWGLVQVWMNQGRNYSRMGRSEEALRSIKKAEDLAVKLNVTYFLGDIYRDLSGFYEDQKNFLLALEYNRKAVNISDSLQNESNNQKLAELEKRYEAANRKKNLDFLEQKNKIQRLELSQKNAWLFGLIVFIILGGGAISVLFRDRKIRADHHNMVLQQRVLLSQMNPHFLFNSLTAIQSFILEQRNEEANSYLFQLASLVRAVLDTSRQDFIPLRKELQVLEDYLTLQNLRFNDQLSYSFDIDPAMDVDEIAIPPMLAQPFIENSLEHGQLMNNPEALIRVKICCKGDMLIFEITDNGIGIEKSYSQTKNSSHRSLATSIALDRVKIYNYKQPGGMKFEIIDLKHIDPDQHGTRVTFRLPCMQYFSV